MPREKKKDNGGPPLINAALVAKLMDRGVDMDWRKIFRPETLPKLEYMLAGFYHFKKPWKYAGHGPDYRALTDFVLETASPDELQSITYKMQHDIFHMAVQNNILSHKMRLEMRAQFWYFADAVYNKISDYRHLEQKMKNFQPIVLGQGAAKNFNQKSHSKANRDLDDMHQLTLGVLVLLGRPRHHIKLFNMKRNMLIYDYFKMVRDLAAKHGDKMAAQCKIATTPKPKKKRFGLF